MCMFVLTMTPSGPISQSVRVMEEPWFMVCVCSLRQLGEADWQQKSDI
jgi:hypothetical protein